MSLEWLIGGSVAILFWFARLEAKVMYLDKDHSKLEILNAETKTEYSKKIDNLTNGLLDIKVSLARIEGSLARVDEKKD